MDVLMTMRSMLMRMGMDNLCVLVSGRESVGDPLRDPGKVEHTQQNQHQADREFHRQPNLYWNYQVEENNSGSNYQNRQRMAKPPEGADQAGMTNAVLAAYDRGDGDDVVGIGGVPHPEEESESDNGEQIGQTIHKIGRTILDSVLIGLFRIRHNIDVAQRFFPGVLHVVLGFRRTIECLSRFHREVRTIGKNHLSLSLQHNQQFFMVPSGVFSNRCIRDEFHQPGLHRYRLWWPSKHLKIIRAFTVEIDHLGMRLWIADLLCNCHSPHSENQNQRGACRHSHHVAFHPSSRSFRATQQSIMCSTKFAIVARLSVTRLCESKMSHKVSRNVPVAQIRYTNG